MYIWGGKGPNIAVGWTTLYIGECIFITSPLLSLTPVPAEYRE